MSKFLFRYSGFSILAQKPSIGHDARTFWSNVLMKSSKRSKTMSVPMTAGH